MTISKGKRWEREAPTDLRPIHVADDAGAASVAFANLGRDSAAVSLASGDLLRTLGYHDPQKPVGLQFPMDLGLVSIDGGPALPFAAHVVARGFLWSGECLAAMNAPWLGELYLGPKGHPNDGLLDITFGSLGIRQRLLAVRRAKLGTHLPHPALTAKRSASYEHQFSRSVQIYVDGSPAGKGTRVSLELISDAFSVIC